MPRFDFFQSRSHWNYCHGEERDSKELQLNCGSDHDFRLIAASSKKHAIRTKRLS